MKRPLAYITAPWSNNQYENAENAATYCRQVYDAGYSPICPVLFLSTFLKDEIPQEHKDGLDMARDYSDVERGEQGSSEEHLTVTQFKVEREQERLEQLTAQTQQKEQQAASLEKKIENIQKQQIAVQKVEQIEPHAVPFSSKVMLERSEYENLAATAKKFYVQERKESKLQKALEAAMKVISELKAKVAALTAELAEYKSVRGQLNAAGLEQQNELLRNKLHRYETVIERNGLWNLFRPSTKTKDITRQEERL